MRVPTSRQRHLRDPLTPKASNFLGCWLLNRGLGDRWRVSRLLGAVTLGLRRSRRRIVLAAVAPNEIANGFPHFETDVLCDAMLLREAGRIPAPVLTCISRLTPRLSAPSSHVAVPMAFSVQRSMMAKELRLSMSKSRVVHARERRSMPHDSKERSHPVAIVVSRMEREEEEKRQFWRSLRFSGINGARRRV